MPGRRRFLAGAAAVLLTGGWARAQDGVFVISRDRILRESKAAQALREVEVELTEKLQAQIDKAKVVLATEEAEITRLRPQMSQQEFELRAADFDRKVRQTRRVTQERARALQKSIQDARAAIVAAMPEWIDRIGKDVGARIILNGDQVIAVDPALDLTDRVIALIDAEMPDPPMPDIDIEAPIVVPTDDPEKSDDDTAE